MEGQIIPAGGDQYKPQIAIRTDTSTAPGDTSLAPGDTSPAPGCRRCGGGPALIESHPRDHLTRYKGKH